MESAALTGVTSRPLRILSLGKSPRLKHQRSLTWSKMVVAFVGYQACLYWRGLWKVFAIQRTLTMFLDHVTILT